MRRKPGLIGQFGLARTWRAEKHVYGNNYGAKCAALEWYAKVSDLF